MPVQVPITTKYAMEQSEKDLRAELETLSREQLIDLIVSLRLPDTAADERPVNLWDVDLLQWMEIE